MKSRARLKEYNEIPFACPIITLELERPADVERLKDKDLDLTLDVHRERRSKDANAYFHVLCGRLADVLRVSKPFCKNMLIGRYGQPMVIDDKPVTIETQLSADQMLEQESLHVKPCGVNINNGRDIYAVMRPTHEYDTREMSILIDGTVEECKVQGIETATPEEIKRMIAVWERK